MIPVPWFEDFSVGDDFSDVPAITITEGMTAIHQAMFGDRQKLPLDHVLSQRVTGNDKPLVNTSLVCNLAIGQTTIASQRVMGNLFYRGLLLRQPVYVGDTLTTTTKVVALKQNKRKEGRAASGMVALEIHTKNQHGDTVLLFWRCPMIPCRDPNADTGHDDDFGVMPENIDDETLFASVPEWNYKEMTIGQRSDRPKIVVSPDTTITIEPQDTVTLAPELVRLTQNLAMTHTDATRSVYGKRLVYGGHTISMAASQLSRHFTNMVGILGWYKCDHTAPVFEHDILSTRFAITDLWEKNEHQLVRLQVETYADRGDQAPKAEHDVKVLDWSLVLLTS